MKRNSKFSRSLADPCGSAIVLVAFWLVIMVAFVGLAIDIGYLMVVRNELQNASDAAALAAARQLGKYYEGKNPPFPLAPILPTLNSTVRSTANLNYAAAQPVSTVLDRDIVPGWWGKRNSGIYTFLNSPPSEDGIFNAVQVTTRRDTEANGTVSTFIASAIGVNSLSATANAIAALTGTLSVQPGTLFPVGLSDWWFGGAPNRCQQPIKFYPANDPAGCAGWDTFFLGSNANNLKDILDNMLLCAQHDPRCNPAYLAPEVDTSDSLEFIGGNVGSALKGHFPPLFEYMKTHDGDGDPTAWTTTVVVYDGGGACGNPHGSIRIVGFAKAKITGFVTGGGGNITGIDAKVACNYVEPSRGGGGNFGLLGSIPGLVK